MFKAILILSALLALCTSSQNFRGLQSTGTCNSNPNFFQCPSTPVADDTIFNGNPPSWWAGNNTAYKITAFNGRLLDVNDGSSNDGAELVVRSDPISATQQWMFAKQGSDASGPYFTIQNVGSSLCITSAGSSYGTFATQSSCVQSHSQFWYIQDLFNNGTLFIQSFLANNCLDVLYSNQANNAFIVQWTCTNQTNADWTITSVCGSTPSGNLTGGNSTNSQSVINNIIIKIDNSQLQSLGASGNPVTISENGN